MRSTHMALMVLAGTIALNGCGSSPAPVAGPNGLSASPAASVANPVQPQPAPRAQVPVLGPVSPGATGQAAPAVTVGTTPAQATGSDATAAVVSGGAGGGGGASTTPPAATDPTAGTAFQVAGGVGWAATDFIVFSSFRFPGEGNNDIYVFDPVLDTVLSVPGVNTFDNEFNPRISDNGKFLVFQRTWGSASCGCFFSGNQDILLYNMDLKLVNTLPMLNTEEFDEFMPDISDDGCNIVYVTNVTGFPEIRLYDTRTGDNWAIPGANRNVADVSWPTISGDGRRIAYGASSGYAWGWGYGLGYAFDGTGLPTGGPAVTGNPLAFGESNIFIYDIPTGTQFTPPFVNTAFDEYNPDLCYDGSRMLFVSNRLGTQDIFEVNLESGWTDNLSFLNSSALDEAAPRYLGGSVDRIVFQVSPAFAYGFGYGYGYGPAGPISLRAYNRATATLDTLPVANHLLADSALRAPMPRTIP